MPGPGDLCCPNCWLWTPASRGAVCRHCGAPLIDPAASAAISAAPSGVPPAAPGVPAQPVFSAADQPRGTNWVTIARIYVAVLGGLSGLVFLLLAASTSHEVETVRNPASGAVQEINVGTTLFIVAVVIFAFTALVAWLSAFAVVRAILIALETVSLAGAVTRYLGGQLTGAYGSGSMVGMAAVAGYIAVLVMTFVAPQPRPDPYYH